MIHLCNKMPNLQGFQRQRLCQVLTDVPPSDQASENIHKQTNIDEVSFETDIGNIVHPDLITSGDIKVFKAIVPGTHTRNGCRGLTGAFDRNREVGGFINRATRLYSMVYPLRTNNCVGRLYPYVGYSKDNFSISSRRPASHGSCLG